jgi:hypothetical protein
MRYQHSLRPENPPQKRREKPLYNDKINKPDALQPCKRQMNP